jgi:type II secretory pathway pseudopilin PulG
MMKTNATTERDLESGFTLVETLVATLVLVFGLMAVTNLLLVAASSNSTANQSSAATTSATQIMDLLKTTDWNSLVAGGDVEADVPTTPPVLCKTLTTPLPLGVYTCDDEIPGVGRIHTRWSITATSDARNLVIRVRSQGTGALAGARSRAEFTTFRACTAGAPPMCPAAPGVAPTPPPSGP